MTRMIPPRPRSGANTSEKRIFDAFAGAHDADDWIVLHSLAWIVSSRVNFAR